MRRIAQTLAVTSAIVGLGLTALPSLASPLRTADGATRAEHAAPPPTAAQRMALERARRLSAVRNQRGAILGLVRGPNGAPEANVCVVARGPLATRRTFTRPDGRFIIAGLPRGAYRVEYRGCSPISRFVGQWYGGLTRTSATPVLVTGSAPVRLPPVTLGMISPRFTRPATSARPISPVQQAGKLISRLEAGPELQASAQATNVAHVSGRVTSRAGHPLARVCVFITPTHRAGFEFLARTAATGRYRLRVRPGRYYVDFLPFCKPKVNFAPQLWKGAGSVAKATVLRVKAGQDIVHIDASLGVGAAITGRVRTHANPHPSLGGLCMTAFGTHGQRLFFGLAITRADGSFRIPSLATGKYQVSVNSNCGRPSPYLSAQLPKPVSVTNGKVTSGITVFTKLGGTITGTVKDTNGKELAGICVEAFSNRHFGSTLTMANGTYRLQGLVGDTYQMEFRPGCGNRGPYAPTDLPNPVVVRQGKVTPHVNAVLQFDGSLTGVVKNSDGKPLGGICVVAESSNFGSAFTRTAADGTYTAKKVPPGNYQVQFIPGGGFSDCGNKGNYLPVSENETVSSQMTTTADAVLPTGGIITGVVRDPHGKPLGGVCVFSTADFGGQAVTHSDGSYKLRQLFTDSYFVGFEGGCGNPGSVAPLAYRGDPTFWGPTSISVTAGQVTKGIDAKLRPGGTITGRITDQAGRPVSGVCADILAITGAGGGFNGFGDFQIDRNGRYTSRNLPPGQYAVFFTGLSSRHRYCGPSPYADQQFSGKGPGAPLDLISVRGGKITSGVDARLALAGKISGVARNKAGTPVPLMCVTATDPRTGTVGFGISLRHGKYVISELPAGRYRVEFSSCFAGFFDFTPPNYANQWYKNHATQTAADTVVVRPARTTPHIDAALTRAGSISGQVVFKPSQRPVSFVCVFAYTPDFSTITFGLTDRRGRYLVNGLSTGSYILEFDPCVGESALAGQIRAGRVHLVAGQTLRGADEQLKLGGSVSGTTRVSLPHGIKAAPGTCAAVLPLSQTASGFIAVSLHGGSYTATNLAPGQYKVFFGDPSCSSNSPSLSAQSSGQIQVTASKTTNGVNATLKTAGGIAGVVRGPGGKPISGICAEAVPLRGGLGTPVGITGAAGGRYLIADLQPGPYKLMFTVGCGASGYATRWYKNARTRQAATIINVKAATVSTGIDISLPRRLDTPSASGLPVRRARSGGSARRAFACYEHP